MLQHFLLLLGEAVVKGIQIRVEQLPRLIANQKGGYVTQLTRIVHGQLAQLHTPLDAHLGSLACYRLLVIGSQMPGLGSGIGQQAQCMGSCTNDAQILGLEEVQVVDQGVVQERIACVCEHSLGIRITIG